MLLFLVTPIGLKIGTGCECKSEGAGAERSNGRTGDAKERGRKERKGKGREGKGREAHFERDAQLLGFDGAQHVGRLLDVLVEARVAAVERRGELLAAQHLHAARAQTLPAREHLRVRVARELQTRTGTSTSTCYSLVSSEPEPRDRAILKLFIVILITCARSHSSLSTS